MSTAAPETGPTRPANPAARVARALARRWGAWPGLAVAVLSVSDLTDGVMFAAAVLLAVGATLGGRLRKGTLHLLQSPLSVLFGAVAVAATLVSVELGSYLVAAGLIGHAVLDAVLWRADRVVARSFAEWCAVLDLVVGAGIIAVTLA